MKPIYAFLLCLFTALSVQSQPVWMAFDGGSGINESVIASREIPTGDVVSIGYQETVGGGYRPRIIKNDGNSGASIWVRQYHPMFSFLMQDMVVTPQGYFACGYSEPTLGADRNLGIAAFDLNGDSLFFKTIPLNPGLMECGYDIDITPGGFIIAGLQGDMLVGNELLLVRTDMNGDTLWTRIHNFGGLNVGHVMGLEEHNNRYYVALTIDTGGSNYVSIAIFDMSGNLINIVYDYTLGANNNFFRGDSFRKISGNRFLLASNIPFSGGQGAYGIFDANGALIQAYGQTDLVQTWNVASASNGDYLVMGTINGLVDSIVLKRYTPAGALVFRKGYSVPLPSTVRYLVSLEPCANGGFLMGGYVGTNSQSFAFNGWIIKTDSMGNVLTNSITGTLFGDFNNNCVMDVGEYPIPFAPVRLMPDSAYRLTDSLGRYKFDAYSGTYSVHAEFNGPLWNLACPVGGSYTTTFPQNNYTTDSLNDFGYQTTSGLCGMMYADLATNGFRACFNRAASIFYSNIGTDIAYNASVVLDLDPQISVTSSSVPYTQLGNQYTFQLGNLNPFQSGTIQLSLFTDCNAITGSTVCASVTAYPDTNCTPPGPNYDNSFVQTEGYCVSGDTVKFALRNIGTGNMTSSETAIIYEDNIIFMQVPYQLPAGDSIVVAIPTTNGKTYLLDTEQHPDYPGLTHPISFVEGCGVPQFSYGIIPAFPMQDLDPYYDIECGAVLTSYDPNDKTGYPLGFSTPHYITANDPLEYTIRFQNTGNDTAYTVMLRDTISPYLELSSLIPGASSHPYTITMGSNREIVFRFDHINLPDSTTNLDESQGFVNYAIRQVNGNTPGTEIKNTAYIYFDFNAAVITNTSLHTIELPAIIHPTVSVEPTAQNIDVALVPNPSTTWIRIQSNQWQEGWVLDIFTLDGRKAMTVSLFGNDQLISVENLAAGSYLYKINDGKGGFSQGKMIVVK